MMQMVRGKLEPDTKRIPACIAHLVGKGSMSNVPTQFDYPLLNMVMVHLQNDDAVGAFRYAKLTSIPGYMRHMVGDIEIEEFTDMVEVAGKIRRIRTPATWVLYPMIIDAEKTITKNGKTYSRRQMSTFVERYFEMKETEEDFEEVISFAK